jgi:hypothetical protein
MVGSMGFTEFCIKAQVHYRLVDEIHKSTLTYNCC